MANLNQRKNVAFLDGQNIDTEEYWINKFSGELEKSVFPYDHLPRDTGENAAGVLRLEFPGELFSKLEKLSANSLPRLQMILITGVVALLSRYSGNKDIVVGTSIYRQEIEAEFINTVLPLRLSFEKNTTFKQLLLQLREDLIRADEHQNYQLELLLQKLGIPFRKNDHFPLFDVAVLLENIQDKRYIRCVNPNLLFSFFRKEAGMGGLVEYNPSLYEKETVARIVIHLERLLQEALLDINLKIDDIPLLTVEEKKELLFDVNQTSMEYPKNKTIHMLFQEQAEKTPDRIALQAGDGKRMTYRQLNNKSNRLARGLREKGVTRDTIVAIEADLSMELLIGILGILKAGGGYLPMDPKSPAKRIKFVLEDSNAPLLLTKKVFAEELRIILQHFRRENIILLDEEGIYTRGDNEPAFTAAGKPRDLAYIIYTSGTTGNPKGVMIEHGGLVNYIWWAAKMYVPEGTVSFPLWTSIAFDLTITSIFIPLITGNAIVIYGRGHQEILIEHIVDDNKVDLVKVTPSHLKLIRDKKIGYSSIKCFIVGGEELQTQLAKDIYDNFDGNVEIYNEYGPTEATVGCMVYKFNPVKDQGQSVPIGIPAGNIDIYILDENLNPVPMGIVGEIFVSGDGIARGYLSRPELTSEKFIPNPFLKDQRMYRTGDLAIFQRDGSIQFLGRTDSQVKIRGFRIELGEIESRLCNYSRIKEAVIQVRENKNGEKYLCAYVVLHSTDNAPDDKVDHLDLFQLRDYLSDHLTDYMIPAYFVMLDAIPLTHNGKVDWKALSEHEINRESEYISPGNRFEEKMVEIWSEVLEINKEAIGIGSNFFDLGGHSLSAIILLSKLHSEFDVKLKLTEIFKFPTIRELEDFLKQTDKEVLLSIKQAEEKEYYSSSSAQKRLYILQQLEAESTAYNIRQRVVLEGNLKREKLEDVFKKLIKRHESLRTSFILLDEQPMQRIHREVEFEIKFHKVEEIEQSYVEIERIIGNFVRPFDLSHAPLLRAGLVEISKTKYILMVDMHHIISDGISQIVLIKDFIDLYKGNQLYPLSFQYKDFSEWQNLNEQRNALETQGEFWLGEFEEEIPVLHLPTDYTRSLPQSFEGSTVDFEIGTEETRALKKLSKEKGVTLYILLLTAFNVLLARLSYQEDIIIGTPVAGRRHVALEQIIGMFVNTLALRNRPKGEDIFPEFLQAVKENTLKALENQDYPFEELLEKLPVKRDISRNPLFDVMFILQNIDFPQIEIPGLTLMPYVYQKTVAKFDLTLISEEIEEKLRFSFEYCTKIFKRETIERFINYYKKIITEIIKNPGKILCGIEIIPEEEKRKLLHEFNDTGTGFPKDKNIHQLFEEQAEKTPDRTAIAGSRLLATGREESTGEFSRLTYSALNLESDRLAHLLREKSVRPGAIVCLMMERSIEMLVGILGILKSGGAYLPIDPGYPGERINYILADSRADLLVTKGTLVEEIKKCIEVISIDAIKFPGFSSAYLPNASTSGPSDLAYIIYTSGSTGKPKGTPVTHRSVNNYSHWFRREFQISEEDKFCFTGSFCFDMSVTSLIVPLISGASIYTVKEKIEREPQVYTHYLAENKISIIKLTPTQFRALKDFWENEDLNSLRYIILGGEAVDGNDVRDYLAIYNHQRIVNEYGPTEATVATVFYVVGGNDFGAADAFGPAGSSLPIGRPIFNTRIYILDKYTNAVPVWVVGELCIAGESVVPGYLNKPELTAEKFITFHGGLEDAPIRIYRTGDLARWRVDGNIEYLGRTDSQVKIKGYRIELDEIEAVLAAHEGLKAGVIAVKKDAGGNDVLVAYVIPKENETTAKIREYLGHRLPAYMVPSLVSAVEELPVAASGKVDRKKLPGLSDLQPAGKEPYSEPAGENEKILADTWENVLGVGSVGVDDNFFHLGGDSIKAIQVVSRLRKYKFSLQVKDLFLHPTVKQLSRCMKRVEKAKNQGLVQGEVEFTPIQEWFFEKYYLNDNTGFTAYYHFNQSTMLYRREGFKCDVLQQVFRDILRHHDALRMVFPLKGGKVVQQNRGMEEKLFDLEIIDLEDADSDTDIEIGIQKAANGVQQGMNLPHGPLVRMGLFKTKCGDYLLIAIHHLAVDGVSWRILLEDFAIGYRQAVIGQPVTFQDKTDSFQYWALKLKEYAESPEALKELEYWKALKDAAPESLSLDLPMGEDCVYEKQYKHRDTINLALTEEESGKLLRKANRAYNTEINDILLAALGLAIKDWTGVRRVLLNLEGHGREDILENVDISRTVGWFTTLFPVALDLTRTSEKAYFIKQVKETLRQVPNRGIGYGILRYLDGGKREEIAVEPEISFNYLGEFGQENHSHSDIFTFSQIGTGSAINPELEAPYRLDISGRVLGKKLTMTFAYCKYEYERATIEKLVESYRSHLVDIIEECSLQTKTQLTPSDLDYQSFTIDQLAVFEKKIRETAGSIENVYRLSPMQSGMYYHYLMDEDTSLYFEQFEISLQGEIDRDLLQKSFNMLLERYSVLRTIFVREGCPELLQIVVKKREAPLQFADVSNLQGEALDNYIESFKQSDRDMGFDLAGDILIRIALLKTGNANYKIILSFHHIIMDGWCTGIIFRDLLQIYVSLREDQPTRLGTVKPYSQYIKWLESRDKNSSLEFWKEYLDGYRQPAELPKSVNPAKNIKCSLKKHHFLLQKELTGKLVMLAKENRVTVNALIQTLWGLLLQKLNYTDDVVFGGVVSGRPQIEDVEHMVGLFINTIPIRVRLSDETKTFNQLAADIQQKVLDAQPHEYVPLAEVESCSFLKNKLVNHIIVFENYPVQKELSMYSGLNPTGFEIKDLNFSGKTNYDFHIKVIPGETIRFVFTFNTKVYGTAFVKKVASYFIEMVKQVASNPGIEIEKIELISPVSIEDGDLQHEELNILKEVQGDFGF